MLTTAAVATVLRKGHLTMNNKINIAFLGGDRRQYCTASMLNGEKYNIGVWGLDFVENTSEHIRISDTVEEALGGADCVVFPLPSTMDGINLHTPQLRSGIKIRLSEILKRIEKGRTVIGGRIPTDFKEVAAEKGIIVVDYYESEAFQIENAYLTAEAALSIAMNQLNRTIKESSFAILGYGRIAKHLAALLRHFGAEVTVFARRQSELVWAESIGCKTRRIDTSKDKCFFGLLEGFDVIYNTIPVRILTSDILEEIGCKTFIIDLASVPGGVDICAARSLGSNVLWATSLPGKYAPESAGRLIAHSIEEALSEEVEQ